MAEPTPKTANRIILGSGNTYAMLFDGDLPDIETICTEANRFAHTKNGATLTYTPTYYTAKDDLGRVQKTVLTEEAATLKLGVCTVNAFVLDKFSATGRVTEDSVEKRRTIKIGGVSQDKRKSYVWCFHHPDPIDGDIWVLVVGKSTAGFEMAFAKDSETIMEPEITAEAQDTDGTLITYIEADETISAQTLNEMAKSAAKQVTA